jgi:NAD-dependent deacetylase
MPKKVVNIVNDYTSEEIDKAVDLIIDAKYCIVLTGAGISTESGIPDFRSPEHGLWTKIKPNEIYKVLSDPRVFWKVVDEIGPGIMKAKPNKAHIAIEKLRQMKLIKTVITQNIDGLHQEAGTPLAFELHGSAKEFQCIACHGRFNSKKIIKSHKPEDNNVPPYCPSCGGQLMLNVVLFGQNLDRGPWFHSAAEAQKADLIIVVGSSLLVAPANELPIFTLKYGGKVMIINNEPTDLDSRAELVLRGSASKILDEIFKKIKKKKK